jgi:hypothetical protein
MSDLETTRCEHAVHFYDSAADLSAVVVPYLAAGADAEEALVVIAQDTHRRAFEEGMRSEGIDLAQARAAGTLALLDAQTTLDAFMPDGELDPARFQEVVGGMLHEAARRAVGIRAYGEMVGLLWTAGDVAGAIELERLWNELARELEFSLFCGYPSASVSDPEQQEAVQEVCELHSVVVPSAGAGARSERLHLPAEKDACARARRFVRGALRRWGLAGSVVDHAVLVSSELAANAVVHARSPFLIEVAAQDDTLRISVSDTATAPRSRWRPQRAHGLGIVDALSESWGVSEATDGKTVWALLTARVEVCA